MGLSERIYEWIGRGAVEDAVMVAGTPRSGTTWLAELLATLPDYKHLDEPLHLKNPALLDLDWRTYVAPDARRPRLRAYLERVFRGQTRGHYKTEADSRLGRLVELYRRPSVVAKFVRAHRMLHWIDETFDLRGIVILVRHPCAVVASQLDYEHSETNDWAQASPDEKVETVLAGALPESLVDRFAPLVRDLDTGEEVLAALWAVDTYCALRLRGDPPGHVVAYEDLVASPRESLDSVFASLGTTLPKRALEHVDVPSDSAASDLHRKNDHRQLSKWKRKLTDGQVDRIISVVRAFDLDLYSEDLHPAL
jgi:hypothetical protein